MARSLTTKEVAARLRVTASGARRLLRAQRLRGTKRGRTWRVRRADLEEFLAEPLVEQGMVEEAERRRRTSKGGLTLEELRKRLGFS
jgi:excisionase family DNA binding protein